jgi:hypothetical protein
MTTRDEALSKIKDKLIARQQAYGQVFSSGEFAKAVLKDLARFCRAEKTTFHPDARVHAALEGRREVWLRIQEHVSKDQDQFLKHFFGDQIDDDK